MIARTSTSTLLALFGCLAAACSTPSAASVEGAPPAAPPTSAAGARGLGAPLSGNRSVPLAELLTAPERFVGQVVRTSGPVRAVCRHRGCWMDLGAESEIEGRLHVRSLDHSLTFPAEAVGRIAEVEGEVQAMPGVPGCGGHEDDSSPACGVAAGGRRLQLAVSGAVLHD